MEHGVIILLYVVQFTTLLLCSCDAAPARAMFHLSLSAKKFVASMGCQEACDWFVSC